MRQLLYVSNTSARVAESVLQSILAVSRINNAKHGITGILLYLEGGFLQVLEGEGAAVADTLDRIHKDPRHWNTMVLLDREAPRVFTEWSMGYTRATQETDPAGVFALTSDALAGRLSSEAPAVIVTLLQTFYRVNSSTSTS